MKPHIGEFYSIVMDLQNIKIKLDDKDLAIYLLVHYLYLTSILERLYFMVQKNGIVMM